MLASVILAATFAAASVASGNGAPVTQTIKWTHCKQNASIPIKCGTLKVPLDYLEDSSGEQLELQLVRVQAVRKPKEGSIIFNPGGPGEAGQDFITGVQDA